MVYCFCMVYIVTFSLKNLVGLFISFNIYILSIFIREKLSFQNSLNLINIIFTHIRETFVSEFSQVLVSFSKYKYLSDIKIILNYENFRF